MRMKFFLLNLLLVCTIGSVAQDTIAPYQKNTTLDSLYREDQFYLGFSFNLLLNRPENITQSGFSGGLSVGFIRDMPMNKRRNVSMGVGVGYAFNTFNHNLFIRKDEQQATLFSSLEGVPFESNRFTYNMIEMPIQLRLRTSVPDTHKFYRAYLGMTMGYIFEFDSKFKDIEEAVVRTANIEELNPWRIGATFTFGWNTVNFHCYYSLNTLFNDSAVIEGNGLDINTFRMGLMFYLL